MKSSNPNEGPNEDKSRSSTSGVKEAKKLKYGQPARRIADNNNPVELGEEESGSYTDQSIQEHAQSENVTDNLEGPKTWKH